MNIPKLGRGFRMPKWLNDKIKDLAYIPSANEDVIYFSGMPGRLTLYSGVVREVRENGFVVSPSYAPRDKHMIGKSSILKMDQDVCDALSAEQAAQRLLASM